MDLEGQGRIRQVVEREGTEDVVAVLGANSPAAVEMPGSTLRDGDQSSGGPRAGIALGIPSYHILEPEIVAQVDSALYDRELALSALAMDVAEVIAPMQSLRNGG